MWNIAHASTKQNYIVSIRIHLPTQCHQNKIYQNQFYFVANAQLFDSSELNEILPMSNMAVNIAAALHIFI